MTRPALHSPRASRRSLQDLGERSALIAGQRVGRSRRQARRLARGLVVAVAALLLAGLGGAGVHWLLTSPRFAVRTIEVRGASRVPEERILAAAGIEAGTNLWWIDPIAVVARVGALPEIRRAEVIRDLPDRVTILVEERQPFTLVSSRRLHWIDEEGWLLGEAGEAVAPPVPVISGLTEQEIATLRTAPSLRARAALALIRTLLRSGSPLAAQISEIDMSRPEGPVLYTVDGIEVQLGQDRWEERLARLEGVLAQVASRDEGVRAIDLRFRDQVVLKKGGRG